jgi:hypothetical protein
MPASRAASIVRSRASQEARVLSPNLYVASCTPRRYPAQRYQRTRHEAGGAVTEPRSLAVISTALGICRRQTISRFMLLEIWARGGRHPGRSDTATMHEGQPKKKTCDRHILIRAAENKQQGGSAEILLFVASSGRPCAMFRATAPRPETTDLKVVGLY